MPFITNSGATIAEYIESLYSYSKLISGRTIAAQSNNYIAADFDGVSTRLLLDTYNNNNNFGSSVRGVRYRGNTLSPSGVLSGDTILHFAADGYNNSGLILNTAVALFYAAEDFTTGANGTSFRLRLTKSGTNYLTDRLRINSDGNIGLSHDNANYRLDVSGAGNFTDGVYDNGIRLSTNYQLSNYSGYVNSNYYLLSNPSGYISNSGFALLSLLTGISGYLQSQVNIDIGNLSLTGSTLDNKINNASGNLQGQVNLLKSSNYVTGISVTGGISITGNFNINAGANITLTQQGNNTLSIAGVAGAGEANTASNLGNGSGIFFQKSILDLQFKSIKAGSNDIYITGSNSELAISFTGLYITPLQTGQFYPSSNPQNYSTSGNLQSTGSILDNKINNLSGYSNNQFYTKNNESGFLNTLSGISTGYITGISGSLQSQINNISSNLTITGSTLDSKVNSLSGYSNTTFSTIANLALTGQQTLSAATNNSVNLSGNLQLTGSNLQSQINNLGGAYIVYTTGNQNIGGNKLFSGNHIFFDSYPSGIGYTGVSGLVYQTGVSGRFYVNDTGNSISIDFYNRTLSGNWNVTNLVQLASTGSNLQSQINTANNNLGITGSTLDSKVNSLSGYSNNTFATIVNLALTGQQVLSATNSNSTNISGNLQVTAFEF